MKEGNVSSRLCHDLSNLISLYSKITEILDSLCESPVLVKDPELNESYVSLLTEIERIEDGRPISRLHISPPPLFESVLGHLEDLDADWREGTRPMVAEYLGKIKSLLTKHNLEEKEPDHKIEIVMEKANESVKRFIKSYHRPLIFEGVARPEPKPGKEYVWGELRFNLTWSTLRYEKNKPIEISTSEYKIKFLELLFQTDGVVNYLEFSSKLGLNCDHPGAKSEDVSRDVQFIKRDLVDLLKKIGMPKKEIKRMILTKRKVGYKLNREE